MQKPFSKGRIIAFFISLVIVFFMWGLFFTRGGLGANIVLGVILAVMAVYMISLYVGNWIDDQWFHGGSRARLRAYRALQKFFNETNGRFHAITKNKKKRAQLGSDNYIGCKKQLSNIKGLLNEVRKNWLVEKELVDGHTARLKKTHLNAESFFSDALNVKKEGAFAGTRSLVFALLAAFALRYFVVEPFQIPSGSMIPTLLVGDHLFVSKMRYGIPNPFADGHKYIVRWSTPNPGDVVVFRAPSYVGRHAGQPWIKRVLAGPGQTIGIHDGVVHVDNKPYPHIGRDEIVKYKDYFDAFPKDNWRDQVAIHSREKIGDIEHSIYRHPPAQQHPFEKDWPLFLRNRLPGLDCGSTECVVQDGYVFVSGDNRGNSHDSRMWGALPIENIKGKAMFIWISVDGSRELIDWGRFVVPAFRWDRMFRGIH